MVGIAAAAHQGFSANLYTITSDMFPNRAVGSVTGIGGMAGAIGGMLMATIVGHLLALGFIQLLAPHLEPANFSLEKAA